MDSIIKDNIKVQFIDSFFANVGKNAGSKMMSAFKCDRVPALENFIVRDYNGQKKPYIVWNTDIQMIVGYFTLITTCMVIMPYEKANPEHTQEKDVEKIISCVELEHFALNDVYLKWLEDHGHNNKGIGNGIFYEYICDIVAVLSSQINFSYLVLHAYNNPKVIEAYRKMGFRTMKDDAEDIVPMLSDVRALHCDYAGDCRFMFEEVESILFEVVRRNAYVQ